MTTTMLTRKVITNLRSFASQKRRFFQKSGDQETELSRNERFIAKSEVERFMVDCLTSVNVPKDRAEMLAQNLSEADARGHFSHGLNRLAMYVSDIENGLCDVHANPKILKESVSTAWVDGCNTLGVVVGTFAMKLAIQKAKETGIGWVAAKGSNHFGICQWYTSMATHENLLGMASTNTSPLVAPTRGQATVFGTNPIAVAANGNGQDGFILDMSTSSVAVGKIEMQLRKGEQLPSKGWALGKDGQPTLDAHEAFYNGKGLMPLGGEEINSGYKGYGLGMVVDILCAVLSGANYGHHVRHWQDYSNQVANLGHFFVALDPQFFAPGFSDRLQELMDHLRQLTPVDPDKPVLVPGDPEKIALSELQLANNAIFYTNNHILTYRELAQKLNVKPMQHQ